MNKTYKTLCDITVANKATMKMTVIPKGTVIKYNEDVGVCECDAPVFCIGITWVRINPHVFGGIKRRIK